jgi:hypothetical protein
MTIPDIIYLLIKVFVIFIALVIADKVIAHEMEIKHILIMAFLCAFIVPFVTIGLINPFLSPFVPAGFSQIFFYGLPLVFWIILGEALLGGEFKEKLIVAFIAFAVFVALDFIGLQSMLNNLISGFTSPIK